MSRASRATGSNCGAIGSICGAVVRSAVETVEPLSNAAGHMLTVDLPETPLWVYADFTRLAQAFANLLNNAVKYTDRGGRITVSAAVEGGRSRGHRDRYRHRHRAGAAAQHFRHVRADRARVEPRAQRPRHRPGAGPPADRAARRPDRGAQRGRRRRHDVRHPLPVVAGGRREQRRRPGVELPAPQADAGCWSPRTFPMRPK